MKAHNSELDMRKYEKQNKKRLTELLSGMGLKKKSKYSSSKCTI